jgi:transposase
VRMQSLRRLARLARALSEDAKAIENDLKALTATNVPQLLAEPGIGPIVAAQLWVSWSHPGRIRSESAFAALAGTSPLPASSGQVTRFKAQSRRRQAP